MGILLARIDSFSAIRLGIHRIVFRGSNLADCLASEVRQSANRRRRLQTGKARPAHSTPDLASGFSVGAVRFGSQVGFQVTGICLQRFDQVPKLKEQKL